MFKDGEAYDYLVRILDEEKIFVEKVINLVQLGDLLVWTLLLIIGFFWMKKTVIDTLKKNLLKTSGMVNLIPIDILRYDGVMRDMFLKKGKTRKRSYWRGFNK